MKPQAPVITIIKTKIIELRYKNTNFVNMNKKKKSLILKKVVNEITETELKIKEYNKLSQPIPPENSIGRISRMDAINNKSVLEAALRELKSKIEKLKRVKKKINSAEFGLCIKCKKSIPYGRIILVPEAEKCVKCAN